MKDYLHVHDSIATSRQCAMTGELAVDRIVGERLRSLRKARDMPIEVLARASERSVGYISQIERGLSSPTLRDVAVLARVLEVPFVELLKQEAPPELDEPVRLKADRSSVSFRGTGIRKRILAPRNRGTIDFYLMEIEVGGTTGSSPYSHDGEEAGFVLKGMILLTIGDREYRLARGDSFRFRSRIEHKFSNCSDRPAEVLWINVASSRTR
jgi:transcriptional regulator with XRE-family HTH domain